VCVVSSCLGNSKCLIFDSHSSKVCSLIHATLSPRRTSVTAAQSFAPPPTTPDDRKRGQNQPLVFKCTQETYARSKRLPDLIEAWDSHAHRLQGYAHWQLLAWPGTKDPNCIAFQHSTLHTQLDFDPTTQYLAWWLLVPSCLAASTRRRATTPHACSSQGTI